MSSNAGPHAEEPTAPQPEPTVPEPEPDGQPGGVFTDIAGLSYEAARDELIAIVARLEAGDAGLEESLTLWRRGEALARHCTTWLEEAEASLRAGDNDDRGHHQDMGDRDDRGA